MTFCFRLGDETGASKVVELIEASIAIVLARGRKGGVVRRNGCRERRVGWRQWGVGGGKILREEGIGGV